MKAQSFISNKDLSGAGRNKLNLLKLSVSAVAMVAFAPAAFAQDAAPAAEGSDTIVVKGIRARLETSQNIKKNADTFVDAVTADDIGALPDKSVTEALQRIPGVTINRFQGADDPLHFSVEGANVVIRGLTYVRSEFNGRDAFSVNSGRSLSFNDISPELLSSVQVYKNGTADRIDGGISGLIDLRTRKPFDKRKLIIAGTIEGLYGDITKEVTPGFSGLISNVFDTGIGDIGVLVSYGQSRLKSTAFGSQIDETIYRPDLAVGDLAGLELFVPRGAGVRTQEFDRERDTFDASLQWEAKDGSAQLTLEYIRATAGQSWGENTAEVDNFDRGARIQGTIANPLVFSDNDQLLISNNGLLVSGALDNGGGLPFNITHRNQVSSNKNEDFSANLILRPTDKLSFTFDAQYARASATQRDVGLLGSVDGNVSPVVNLSGGGIPDITFLAPPNFVPPAGVTDPADIANVFFSNPANVFYRAVLDHAEDSKGDEFAFRADVNYDFDGGILKALKGGARYSDREQQRQYSEYAWGFVSQNWTSAGLSPYNSPTAVGEIVPFAFPNFQRGSVVTPINTLYTNQNIAEAFSSGLFQQEVTALIRSGCCPGASAKFLSGRDGVIPGTLYRPGEINNSREETFSAYGRVDYELEDILGEGTSLNGNFGVRYVNTKFANTGSVTFALGDPVLQRPGGPGTPLVTPTAAQVATQCALVVAGGTPPSYCALSPAQQAQYFTYLNGETIAANAANSYDYFLPSFNANLKLNDDVFIRFAVQRAISRPDFGRTAFSTTIFGNQLATATNGVAIFKSEAGDPFLEGIKSMNYDVGLEYYFSKSSSITLNLFYKKLEDIISSGGTVKQFANAGLNPDVEFNGSVNVGTGSVKGFEIGYQQFYDFLPGPLSGFGFEGNFTYVKPSRFPVTVNETQFRGLDYPLENLSRYTFNASLLYEKYGISARASYNWRSQFLLTPRDVIIPFAPIFQRAGGQLDTSIYYSITPNIKIGMQTTNLLNQVTKTLQQTTFDAEGRAPGTAGYTAVAGPLAPRSFFTNDRRFSFGVRFNF
jgi:TonB-dependent receptor